MAAQMVYQNESKVNEGGVVVQEVQPMRDSSGRKVPVWESKQVGSEEDISSPVSQKSWKTWATKAGSWGISKRLSNYPPSPTSPFQQSVFDKNDFWRPISFKAPVLGTLLFVTLALIAILEILAHISSRNNNENGGGLAFAETQEDLPAGILFLYLYLPTIIAVIYSMTWAWIDLDAKRLEPWYQLSKPEGATAQDSLLLQYPFDFLAFVPKKAGQNKHWAVLITGTTMMFIGWAIVPLQAAIFTTGVVTRNRDTLMVAANGLLTPPEQVVQLDSRFLHTSYGVSWLDQKLPGYTTSEYALLPFMPLQNNSDMLPTETWTAETQMYWTNLTCKPAVNYTRLPTITEFRFDDGDGCVTQFSLGSATNNTFARFLSYVQFWGDANVNIALQNPNCTVERNQHKFLALFGQAEINPFVDGRGEAFYTELTALFCQPTYSMRTVTATVNASSAAVFNVEYDESVPATTVTDDTFNITHYEYLIGTNVIPISYEQTGNVHQTAKVEQVPRLTEQNITFGRAPMTGYGLAASKVDVKLLNDPVNLHQAFDSAHKLLFATFLNQIMVPKVKLAARPPPSEPFIGLRTDRPGSIEFVRAFSIVVEACLGVIAVLTIMLWMFYRKRWNQISSDPGSISDVMKLIRSSQRLLREFDDNGTVTEKALEENLWGHKYRLATLYKNGQPEMQLESTVTIEKLTPKKSPIDCPDQFNTVRPIELTYWCAAVWVTVISAAVAVLTQFYVRSVRENGIVKPSDNEFVMTVLTNLIPTLFATVIEPFWIVLNRLLCILQPFHDLRSGKAKPMPTIEARYTAVPPQLAFWQALRAKHFLLALVCIVSLSTNVLAVTLSGLFEEKPTKVLIPGTTKASLAPEIIGEPNLSMNLGGATVITYSDAFYAAMANQSGQASLPPWAGKSRYYLPFDLAWPNNDNITIQRLAANTRAYEFEPNCRPVGINLDTADEYMSFRPFFNDSRWDLAYVRNLPDGTNITCQLFNRNTGLGAFDIENATSAHTIEEVSALQFPDIIGVPAAPEKTFFCSQRMVAGWGRLGPAVDASTAGPEIDLTNSTEGRSLEATWLFCEPKVKSAMFDVEVDVAGRILGANQTTDYTYDSEAFGTSNQTIVDILLKQMNQITLTGLPQSGRWHNDSFSATWFDSLISIELNSARHFEIGSPLPTSEQMLPLFEKWYKRLTAITMSFDKKLFAKLEQDIIIPVTLETIEERIFLEPVMFYLTVSLLGIQLITLIIFYYCRPGQFLPRMPLSIASLISFVSASHAVQEVGRQTEEEQTFGYGRFKGVDGHTHVGIEKSSLVVPLESRNPEARRRRFTWLRRGDERDPRTWI